MVSTATQAEIAAARATASRVPFLATPPYNDRLQYPPAPGAGADAPEHLDPVEAAIRRARANQRECTVCGPCDQPDALYCASCGRYLPGACAACGAEVTLVGSRFCGGCGHQLAAA